MGKDGNADRVGVKFLDEDKGQGSAVQDDG